MLQQVTDYFAIKPDIDLELMRPNQSLAALTAGCIDGIDRTLDETRPHCVIAQGDTTTVMASSLTTFYHRIPFVHVEAGLRTGNLMSPWPEELNRRITSLTANLHCAPTQRSADNLIAEGVAECSVHVTGNTVIDALLWTRDREANQEIWAAKHGFLAGRRMVLITGHRRENFGSGFQHMCTAIATLSKRFADVAFVYPVHLNPNVQGPVNQILGNCENVQLLPPAPYPEFVWLMNRSTLILSDSGGVQEEAPSLKKPVLVMRDTTERPEAVDAGAVELVGTDADTIVDRVSMLLTDSVEYRRRQVEENPYGDGKASNRIVDLLLQQGWS
jgi:UDP-N-acetylglucosamine 2-epimerase (non-hydrolysing)